MQTVNTTPSTDRMAEHNRTEAWLFRLLVAFIALVPLPLASNRPLPAAIAALAAGLLLLVSALLGYCRGGPTVTPARIRLPLILYGATCLWVLVQWLPFGWLPGVAAPIWDIASEATGRSLPGRISVNPDATLTGLMHLLAYGAVFWLALQLTHRMDRARTAMRAVAAIGTIYAVYGIIVFLLGNEWILGWRKWAYHGSLTSTFVNRNSFATFAGLSLVCAAAALALELRVVMAGRGAVRARIAIALEHLFTIHLWLLLANAILLITLFLTASRAGMASTGLGLAVFLLIALHHSRNRTFLLSVTVLGAFAAAAIGFAVAGAPLAERYESRFIGMSAESRAEIYRYSGMAIRSAPMVGHGYGTFSDVIPAYRISDRLPTRAWDKAHNSYLENAVELGLPAAASLNLAILLLGLRAVGGGLARRNWAVPAAGAACTALAGFHSVFDFSLQIPAVAFLFAFVLGVAVSQSWRRAPR